MIKYLMLFGSIGALCIYWLYDAQRRTSPAWLEAARFSDDLGYCSDLGEKARSIRHSHHKGVSSDVLNGWNEVIAPSIVDRALMVDRIADTDEMWADADRFGAQILAECFSDEYKRAWEARNDG